MPLQRLEGQSLRKSHGGLKYRIITVDLRHGLRVEPACANPLRRSAARSEIKEPRLIPRYTREQIGAVWRDANKYANRLEVELAATETLPEPGDVPKEAAAKIRANANIDVARNQEIESRVK